MPLNVFAQNQHTFTYLYISLAKASYVAKPNIC